MTSAYVIMPEIAVTVLAMLMLIFDATLKEKHKSELTWLATVGFILALLLNLSQYGDQPQTSYAGMISMDSFTVFLNTIFLSAAILVVLMAPAYLRERAL